MTATDQITLLGAVDVLGFLVLLVALATGLIWLLERCGLLDDPDGALFEDDDDGEHEAEDDAERYHLPHDPAGRFTPRDRPAPQ